MSRSPRSEERYALDTGLRLLKVLEALEGTNFEPVSIQRVQERTKFPYDFCRRALITLKLAGFAAENNGKWMPGPKPSGSAPTSTSLYRLRGPLGFRNFGIGKGVIPQFSPVF